jgi:adenine-specific DNA methylase
MTRPIYAQASLFRHHKLAESTIAYTPGPNPDLGPFVAQHATPYDPAADDYNAPPFDQPITSTKATAIYNMHAYWSKKPHDAIQQYIQHYTSPGDLVLDPMCGSGGTALAALVEGRTMIAIDLSPAATFITKNYCSSVDVASLQIALSTLEHKLDKEMHWLYGTRCDRCDGRAITSYTVYSHVYQCPRCLEKVPLFDCVEAQGQTAKGKPKKINACPRCFKRGQVEEVSTLSKKFEAVPVMVSYLCEEGCTPKRAQRRHNDADKKKRAYFEKYDIGKLHEIEARTIPYWIPPHRMMNVESDTEPWGDKWRAGTSNFRAVAELFTKRNLWALAAIRQAIMELSDPTVRDKLLFAFEGILLINSKMCRYETTQTQSGTYYLPPVYKELFPLGSVGSKVRVISEAEDERVLKSAPLLISTQSAKNLAEISPGTIDYIFTDPPYAGNVQYGELNFIWEAWLDFDTSWHDQEIIVNETRGVSEHEWARMMRQAMQECYRVLKPGRWLSLCYHDTSEGTWQLVQDLMAEVGFISENTDAALYIDTGQKSFNQLMAEKVTRRDLVINFRKPRPDELPPQLTLLGDEDDATFAEKARAILREALEAHPGRPADRLYDELVSRMVRQRAFERHNFDELLRSVAEAVDGRYYLLATAGQVDAAESAREEAAAARLAAFMQTTLAQNPGAIGVHFSDLFEQNLTVLDKPRRDLKEWLPEFFFRTEAGAWRPPASDEEHEQKATLRASGALRRIKRFGHALLEGVPPAGRDRPDNVATAAAWLRQCRRAGLYELGRVLYEKGGLNFTELSDEAMLEVEEDYQICVRRS